MITIWNFYPTAESGGSFYILHGWFTVLLTVFHSLLTIVGIDLSTEMTGYYTKTLGRLTFPLTSCRHMCGTWSVLLYRYSNSLLILKDDAYAIPYSAAWTTPPPQVRPYFCLTQK